MKREIAPEHGESATQDRLEEVSEAGVAGLSRMQDLAFGVHHIGWGGRKLCHWTRMLKNSTGADLINASYSLSERAAAQAGGK